MSFVASPTVFQPLRGRTVGAGRVSVNVACRHIDEANRGVSLFIELITARVGGAPGLRDFELLASPKRFPTC
jgi:hypothetical protein